MDPETVHITIHALGRFQERRRGKIRPRSCEREIRKLLGRARELMYFKSRSDGSRFFLAEPWYFVLQENRLVTVYREEDAIAPGSLKRKMLTRAYLRKKLSRQRWKWR